MRTASGQALTYRATAWRVLLPALYRLVIALAVAVLISPITALASTAATTYDDAVHVYDTVSTVVSPAIGVLTGRAPPLGNEATSAGHPAGDSRFGVAANSGDDLLNGARAVRDAKAAEVGRSKATVTGGYGRDGRPVAGCSSNPIGCAEDDVARQIGGDPKDITFTEATRPRTGDQVPICPRCQGTYDQSQFPSGTLFDPAGPWGSK